MPKTKYLSKSNERRIPRHLKKMDLEDCPNFSATGSISGMKKLFYGKSALLVRQGKYIYNVSRCPVYYDYAR